MNNLFTEMEKSKTDFFNAIDEFLDNRKQKFFNTTNESGSQLIDSNRKAMKQNDVVFELFKQFGTASPSQIYQVWATITGLTTPPITSIRRAITTLTDEGKLEKLDSMKKGLYGKDEHEWRIAI
jgi:hypothetical protein